MNKIGFRWRVFVSLFLLLAFLLSAVSGGILFLRPEGSLAAWSGWSALGLDKKAWEGLHAVSVFFFLLGAVAHLAFHWRSLLAYCRGRGGQGRVPGRLREFAAALVLAGLLLAGTLGKWPPLRWIVDLRAWLKGGAAVMETAPPADAAWKLTLAELCPLLGVDGTRLLEDARRRRLRVESLAQTLEEVARTNGLSPQQAYRLLFGK
ncbi:MAG: DUF4405 domain-containing protein [Candidatus Aminicenantes bacterium]|nr:DUF4405 domain-containing protein [Candidatus Aminicenantes bacterium]